MTDALSTNGEGALAWAEAKQAVFPCHPGQKTPATPNGLNDATIDPALVRRWWTECPDRNIAVVPDRAGCYVLDVDGKTGAETLARLIEQRGPLPDTLTIRTPHGTHYWFRGSVPSTVGKLGPKLDTRGRGGYVLVCPSVVHGKAYDYASDTNAIAPGPEWIAECLADSARDGVAATGGTEFDTAPAIGRARELLQRYVAAGHVAIEGSGGDNRTYAVAAEVLNLGLSVARAHELLRDEWNPHCIPPWTPDDLLTKVSNAAEYCQNEQGAWAVPPAQEIFADAAKHAYAGTISEKRGKFCVLLPRDMRSLPPPSWLVADLIPANAVGMLYGPTGTFKTFLALIISLAIAVVKQLWGKTTAQGAVAYCAGEAPVGIARVRIPALMQHYKVPEPDDVPLALVPAVPLVSTPAEVEALTAALKATGLRFALIVIDTVARALGGLDENSAKDAGLLLAAAERLRDTFNCSVLLIHHTGKDESRGARGSSALLAGVDFAYEVKAETNVLAVSLRCEKMKDADPPAPIRLQGSRAYGSVVFDLIRETEYAALTRSNTSTHNSDVGQALKVLRAVSGSTVTTHVLATEMAGPGAPIEVVDAKRRALQRGAKKHLRAYVAQLGEGSGHATLWTFQQADETGGLK